MHLPKRTHFEAQNQILNSKYFSLAFKTRRLQWTPNKRSRVPAAIRAPTSLALHLALRTPVVLRTRPAFERTHAQRKRAVTDVCAHGYPPDVVQALYAGGLAIASSMLRRRRQWFVRHFSGIPGELAAFPDIHKRLPLVVLHRQPGHIPSAVLSTGTQRPRVVHLIPRTGVMSFPSRWARIL